MQKYNFRFQGYVISVQSFRTNFENYAVAFSWPIFSQNAFASFARCVCPQNMNVAEKNVKRQHNVKRW